MIPHRLKVAIDQYQIDLVIVLGFQIVNLLVSRVKLSMTASRDGNLHVEVRQTLSAAFFEIKCLTFIVP